MNLEPELRALQLRVISLEAQVSAHERERNAQWGAIIAATLMAVSAMIGAAVLR